MRNYNQIRDPADLWEMYTMGNKNLELKDQASKLTLDRKIQLSLACS